MTSCQGKFKDDSDPHEIIPISFNIKEILKTNYQNMVSVQSITGKSVTQNAIPKVNKIPIKTEKDKDSKPLHSSVVNQQLLQGLLIPPGNIIPLSTHPSVSVGLPPKPPNAVEDATSSPNLGQDPNVDFEENSPHQEGIITEMYVA